MSAAPETTTGSYVLVLRMSADRQVSIGCREGRVFVAGYYCYCGSALGPGGLAARLARHLRSEKRLRWHIDYLLPHVRVAAIWTLPAQRRLECVAASALRDLGCIPISGFGSSDCHCAGHLLHSTREPDLRAFRDAMGARREGVRVEPATSA